MLTIISKFIVIILVQELYGFPNQHQHPYIYYRTKLHSCFKKIENRLRKLCKKR
jgi:hypothetical protein